MGQVLEFVQDRVKNEPGESLRGGTRTRATGSEIPGLGSTRKSLHADQAQTSKIRRYRLQRAAQKLLPGEAVACCQRNLKSSIINEVTIVKTVGGCSYRGLFVCGSIWHCPVCAAKIAAKRSAEIQAAIAVHQARGGSVALVSLTFPHTCFDSLKGNLAKQAKALQIFKNSRSYKRVMERIGNKGSIRALEVTFPEKGRLGNGAHPHTHEIYFGTDSNIVEVMQELRVVWAAAVSKSGLGEINEHGFDVKNGDFAAEYIAKWGHEPESTWRAGDELTRSHMKKGKKKSRTAWQVLGDAMDGDEKSGELFQEYAQCFKGKRQLYYSPGLKEYLAIEELSDAQIAEGEAQEVEEVCSFSVEDWQVVLSHNARGQVLAVAERHGAAGVFAIIEHLKTLPAFDLPWLNHGRRKP